MMNRCCFVMILVLSASIAEAGLVFNFTDTGGAGVGTQARAGFQRAANAWSAVFMDDITVNLDIGFETLGPGILGSAGSSVVPISYTNFRNAVNNDVTSVDDISYAAGLPGGSSFSVFINHTSDNPNGSGSATPYVDADGGTNNVRLRVNRANAKALGLLAGNDGVRDASIKFNNAFNFDFDSSNGITAGFFDYVGIAIHEIGHALGFVSGVDVVDVNSGSPFGDNSYSFVSPLDFTRFSDASELAEADIDFTADNRPKYFSLDGGTTSLLENAWSLGTDNGDGRQASHWKDGRGIGILDPTFGSGELGVISSLDIRAFDAIGYDLNFSVSAVPEPASLTFITMALVGFGGYRLRKRNRNSHKTHLKA